MFNPPSGRFTLLLSALGHLKFPLLRCFTTPPSSHSHALSSCHCYLTATRHSVDPAVLHTSTRDIPLRLGSHLLDVAMRWRAVNSGRGKLFAPLSHCLPSRRIVRSRRVMRWFAYLDPYTWLFIPIGHSTTDILLSSVPYNLTNSLFLSRCLFLFRLSLCPSFLRIQVGSSTLTDHSFYLYRPTEISRSQYPTMSTFVHIHVDRCIIFNNQSEFEPLPHTLDDLVGFR